MSDLHAIVPNEDTRREKLLEQFEQAETVETPQETPRDEQGKFVAKNEQTMVQQEPAAEPVEEPVWKRPPASWKKDYHEVWQSADDRMKEYAWQREEQMKAGVQPLMEKARIADQVQDFFAIVLHRRHFRFHLFVADFYAAMRLQVFAVAAATGNH